MAPKRGRSVRVDTKGLVVLTLVLINDHISGLPLQRLKLCGEAACTDDKGSSSM